MEETYRGIIALHPIARLTHSCHIVQKRHRYARTHQPTTSTHCLNIPTSNGNLLQLPLLGELLIEHLQLLDELLTRADHRLLGTDLPIGLHAQFEGGEEWVWDLVAGEEDVRVFGEVRAEQVAQGVVFFVEGEEGGVGDA